MNNNKLKYIGALILLGLLIQIGASYLLNGILMGIPSLAGLNESYSEIEDQLTQVDARMQIYVMMFAPVIEELVFRFSFIGLTLRLINGVRPVDKNSPSASRIKTFRFALMLVAASVLFGIYHGNTVQGVYAFLLGLMLGYVFYYAGGLIASILVHIIINSAGLYLTPLLPAEIAASGMIIIGAVIMAISVCVMLLARQYYEAIVNNHSES